MLQITQLVNQHRPPTTSLLVLDLGYVGSAGRHAPSFRRFVRDVFGLYVRVKGPLDGCRRLQPPHPRTMMTFRSTCLIPGMINLSYPRIRRTCLVQTRAGSNRTVAPRSQRHPPLDTKDHLGLHHPTRTFQNPSHVRSDRRRH